MFVSYFTKSTQEVFLALDDTGSIKPPAYRPSLPIGLTHELRKNKIVRLLPYVAMTQLRYFCVSPDPERFFQNFFAQIKINCQSYRHFELRTLSDKKEKEKYSFSL
ncbi:hypothetical protein DP116_25960 [Brasilonema bromeliae SPC951]|uniref:Transposase n=1 Tax=Brasilonema bromeliae SPC951 TaxID=385972 RepID=A0ABX1PGU7_9CYAN|nr:hypothetical protein [Brasilonema bromeliae SPC951]